jgi:hypothetical protein
MRVEDVGPGRAGGVVVAKVVVVGEGGELVFVEAWRLVDGGSGRNGFSLSIRSERGW